MRQEQLWPLGWSTVPVCHGATRGDLHNIGNFFPLSDDATATLLRARATPPPPRTAVTVADLGHRGRREREGGETEKKTERGGDRPTEGTHINLEKSFARQVVRRSQCAVQAITRSGVEWHEEAEEQIKCGTQKRLMKTSDDSAGFVESCFLQIFLLKPTDPYPSLSSRAPWRSAGFSWNPFSPLGNCLSSSESWSKARGRGRAEGGALFSNSSPV